MMRSYWDTQFKFSAILPDFSACLEDMQRRSDIFAERRAFERHSYGPHPRQWVEVTRGTGTASVMPVVIHGGYWRALEAERHRAMMAGLLSHGAYVANLEYRLMPDVRLDDVLADVLAGLHTLASKLPGHRFVLVGHSAGAHLAVSAAAKIPAVQSVLAISGIFELWPVAQSFLQDEINLSDAEIAAHTLDPHSLRPPVLYLTGGNETPEFHRQSARMALAANAVWQQLPGAHHMTAPLTATTPNAVHDAFDTLAKLELQT